jgi:autotransporter-associated beta strand protein
VISGYYPGTITPFWSTLQIGNGGSSGTPGTGPIVNDGTLRFNRSGTLRLANVISGTGNLLLDNPSSTDTLILSGSNTFSGGVTIAKGRLVVSNSFALGINGKIINATTGQGGIDLNPGAGSINLDPDIYFTLSGSPSGGTLRNVTGNNIINGQIGAATGAGGSLITSEDGSLTLAGPVQTVNSGGRTITVAGTSTGANLVSGEMADGISTLTITKSGTGLWIFSGANSYTGPTTVSAGTLRIRHDTALGDTSTNTTVATGAKLQLEGVSLHVAEDFVLGTGTTGAIVENVSGDNTLSGSITRNGALTFLATGGKLTILSGIGDTTNALNLQGNGDGELRGAITAADALAKTGAGTWTLFGTNTFVAPATISGGTLRVSGSLANGAVTVSGGTLGGQGTINGPVTVSSGALEPGASSNLNEALTIKNHLVLGSTARFQIGKSGSTPVCDRVISVTNVTYGGTLVVTNVTGATWVGGETFNLFSASGTKSGNFTNVVLQPAVAGVVPSFNPANGTLSLAVITPPTLNVSQLGGGTLQLSWSGSFKLQSQTNTLSVGLGSNWSDYPGGGSSPVSVTPDLTKGSVFFRLSQ